MEKKATITDISSIIQSNITDKKIIEGKYLCSGRLESCAEKKASSGKAYLSLKFVEDGISILVQYFYDEQAFNPDDLEINRCYSFEGVIKIADNGKNFFNLSSSPKLVAAEDIKDDIYFFPILESEIEIQVSESEFYPILYKDLYILEEKQEDSNVINKINETNAESEAGDLYAQLVDTLSAILEKENISIDAQAKIELLPLFTTANRNKLIDTCLSAKTLDFIKILQMKLRFSLMLQSEKTVVEANDIEALIADLFGEYEHPEEAVINDNEDKNVDAEQKAVDVEQKAVDEATDASESNQNVSFGLGEMKYYVFSLVAFSGDQDEATKKLKEKFPLKENEALEIFETLREGNNYVVEEVVSRNRFDYHREEYEAMGFTIGEEEKSVPFTKALLALYQHSIVPKTYRGLIDFEFVKIIDEQIDADENIQYAEVTSVYKSDSIKKNINTNGIIRNDPYAFLGDVYVIYTDKKIIYADFDDRNRDSSIKCLIRKSDIKAINTVYAKKSFGQVQLKLTDGSILVHVVYSHDKQTLNSYAQRISSLVNQLP
jgi:hypothetical protein